jgi:uncharacterized protein YidB (DUF937 family)
MSSLDEVLGGVLGKSATGGAGAGTGQSAALNTLIPMVVSLLAGGGLSKLLEAFKAKGMGAQADSWVGTGQNQPISAADVKEVVGQEKIAEVAKQANISEDQAADVLAQAIPAVVDHVTPEGDVPDASKVDEKLPGVTLTN